MKKSYFRRNTLPHLAGLLLLLTLSLSSISQGQSTTGVLREVFTGIGGGAISDLTNNVQYPCCPTLETIQPTFEAPTDFAENYGTRMRALIIPPTTGAYTFWIASDDNGALYLSSTESPANRALIASVNTWTASREWTKEANQKSSPINLTAGKRYYIEALQKEGGGGDNLAVRWTLPGGAIEEPIPGTRLVPFGLGPPLIAQQPTNTSVIEGFAATFTVTLQRRIGATFQWFRDGASLTGETNGTLLLPPQTLSDSGSLFQCAITNSLGSTNSAVAKLTVLADTTPPTVLTVGSAGENTSVFVVFSEAVDPASATNAANYVLSQGVSVVRVIFGADARTVQITTTPIPAGSTNTLTVSNIKDRATTPNTLATVQRSFTLGGRPIDVAYLSLPREPLGPSTRRHGVVISEVMYHPTNRVDGKNLEFIELYNSQPWFEDISGWRLSGAIDFTFATNVILPARSFLVIAANPQDFKSAYSFTNVHGPFAAAGSLQNSSGSLRLRNSRDAVIFEMTYSGDPPYPPAADGAGHSLILARPSYGERDPRAWMASEIMGGTPGAADPLIANPYRTVVINEFLAHTALPTLDYIELFNYGTNAIDLSGSILTDDPVTNKFTLPPNSLISAGGFLVFDEVQLGFSLAASGETLYLINPAANRVLDAVRYTDQEQGISSGRYPDGAPTFRRLDAPTPGTNNTRLRAEEIVINELMFDPLSGDRSDEFIELLNSGTNRIDLTGWRLREAISYNLPKGTQLDPGGFLVIAANAARMRSNFPHLNLSNCLGDFSGKLGNAGDRVTLERPEQRVGTNSAGQLKTNTVHFVVEEVTYGAAGKWGRWSYGGGSSLELRDSRADRQLASSWADSDETAKSPWVTVQTTGVMDNGWADASQLHITLLGAGEALVDNVEAIVGSGSNLLANGKFDQGTAGWVFQGNHNQTSWEPGDGFGGPGALHLRATGRGDSGANRVRVQLPSTLSPGSTVTLRARARWLKGNPNLLLRLRGNWLDAPGSLLATKNLGSPGLANSRSVQNIGPAIQSARHWPATPAGGQAVTVTAQVSDPDGLSFLAVYYRVDPSTNYLALAMTNHGAGLFSTAIPSQSSGATVAFFIRASDNAPSPAVSFFPAGGPVQECIVRWGDNTVPGTLGTYRWWLSQTNVSRWMAEEKMSNNPKDMTFIYGTNRVIYNAGAWFHGSPYHSPSYDSPVGASCDYDLGFPEDEPLLGETDINLFRPGNGGGDGTAQAEIHGYWFGSQFGIPFLYCRPVFVFVNGQRRETVFLDAQQPNGDFVRQWYPDDADGDLHKVQLGFEFGDLASGASEPGYAVVGATLDRYLTTGNAFKTARYRATLPRRSSAIGEFNDYTNIYRLVQTSLTNAASGTTGYTVALTNAVDVDEWFRTHVTQHLFNNGDSFSYGGGQNAFLYKPERDGWKLFLWDIDFAFGGDPLDPNLFSIGGQEHGPLNTHPPFARIYWQALIEAANGMLTPAKSDSILTARYNGLVAGGAAVGDPSGIKSFIASRRGFIQKLIASNQAPFAIRSNNGLDFSTNRNLIVINGTAPLEVRTLWVNGISYPLSWTTLTNWTLRIPLLQGTNTLVFTGTDAKGSVVASVSKTVNVNFTGVDERPEDKIVINEIHYNPAVPNTGFIELYNRSTSNAFDLSGWRLRGAGFVFPNGSVLEPGTYGLIVEQTTAFTVAYGSFASVMGEYSGHLRRGETLTLIKPGALPQDDKIIDQVSYDVNAPWPLAADGLGASLQLIDPAQDNNRSANWGAATGTQKKSTPGASNSIRATVTAFPTLWLNEIFPTNLFIGTDGITDHLGERDPWVELYNGGTNAISLSGYSLANNFTNLTQWTFPIDASIQPGQFVTVWLDGQPEQSTATEWHASFRADPAQGVLALSRGAALNTLVDYLSYTVPVPGRSYGSYPDGAISDRRLFSAVTPGATNNPAFLPIDVRINEWMAENISTLADPSDGDYEDWFELYNPGTTLVDLTGCYISDSFATPTQWAIPAGTTIPPNGYLLVWADGETGQNGPDVADLHANFQLSKSGEAIVLFSPAGKAIDGVAFGLQTRDVSEGRYPDGALVTQFFTNATPRASNLISSSNTPPTLALIADASIDEGSLLNFAATGSDADLPAQTLTYSLETGAPEGAIVDARTGDFRWVPNENQGPGNYTLTLRVTDSGSPPLSATRTFQVHVNEVNNAPLLAPILGRTIAEGSTLIITNRAIDLDAGNQILTYSLDFDAPLGATIDPVTGVLQWTPTEAQGPGNYLMTVRVTDNGIPPQSDAKSVTVFVSEVNLPPVLASVPDQSTSPGSTLSFTLSATDDDLPGQSLLYSLDAPVPAGASLDPASGRFTWTPSSDITPGNYSFQARVRDDGNPPLSAARSFTVQIGEPLRITSITRVGDQVEIRWSSLAGHHYRLQFKNGFDDASWSDQTEDILGSGSESTTLIAIEPTTQRIYRVVQVD